MKAGDKLEDGVIRKVGESPTGHVVFIAEFPTYWFVGTTPDNIQQACFDRKGDYIGIRYADMGNAITMYMILTAPSTKFTTIHKEGL